MKLKVKNDLLTARLLLEGASVPSQVVDQILGREFIVPDNAQDLFQVTVEWLGKPSTWSLPAECVELIPNPQ